MPAPVLHQAVVEAIGQAIANEQLECGHIVLLDDVIQQLTVSRTVAREAVRILETLGMVAVTRRVGTIVQPRSQWNVMDPRVVRWRMSGPHQAEELDQLMQLRAGIEPIAARLCAMVADETVGTRLQQLADTMLALGEQGLGVSPEFLAADLEFHRLVVTGSGNAHMAAFSDALETLLVERNRLGLLGDYPDPRAMSAHASMAQAISQGRPADAEASSRALVDVVHSEVLAPTGAA